MLSYQHAYHAGNFADVLKHVILVNTLRYLTRKPGAILYLDTHAGDGCYRLNDPRQARTGEAVRGVILVNMQKAELISGPSGKLLECYLDLVHPYLQLGQYPGSPVLAATLMRPIDRIELYELHPSSHQHLVQALPVDRRINIHRADGFSAPARHLPPPEKRAVVLIDPPYEEKRDYSRVTECLLAIWKRMPSAVVLLWYPVVFRENVNRMQETLSRSPLRDVWQSELGIGPDEDRHGMTASGMIMLNPPWEMPVLLRELLPAIGQSLAGAAGYGHVQCLLPE